MSLSRRSWRTLDGELAVYYAMVTLYFFMFGLQMVVFPSLAAFALEGGGAQVGLAQMALSLPMFLLLLVGGQVAERSQAGPTLAVLQALFALPPLALAFVLTAGGLSLGALVAYGAAMGALAAFMLPMRDSALNGVVARASARGGAVALSGAAMTATAIQIGAQIAGILAARFADAPEGGRSLNESAALLLCVQGAISLAAAALALGLRAPRLERRPRSFALAIREIGEGLAYAFKDKYMAPMLWSAAYVGVFVVGSFQVLFPLIVREAYGGGPRELATLFALFWGASFAAALVMSRIGQHVPPGPGLIVSHFLAALVLASFAIDKPLWLFQGLVIVWGLGAGVAMTTSRTITQSAAAPGYLGRVLSIYSMGFMGGAPVGALLVGFGADLLGARGAALLPSIGLVCAATALALFTPIWSLKRPPSPQPVT
jgi:MFS family permease